MSIFIILTSLDIKAVIVLAHKHHVSYKNRSQDKQETYSKKRTNVATTVTTSSTTLSIVASKGTTQSAIPSRSLHLSYDVDSSSDDDDEEDYRYLCTINCTSSFNLFAFLFSF